MLSFTQSNPNFFKADICFTNTTNNMATLQTTFSLSLVVYWYNRDYASMSALGSSLINNMANYFNMFALGCR